MKKSLITFALGLIIISCSENKTSLDNLGLRDEVVKIYEEHFEVIEKSDKYATGDKKDLNNIQAFDEWKNLNSIKYYDNDGDFYETEKYTYDKNHFLIGLESFDSSDELLYKYKYENNENGNPLTITYYNDSSMVTSTVRLNYSFGKVKSGESRDKNGSKNRWVNEFNGNLLTKQTSFDSVGNKTYSVKYEYDDNEFVTKYSVFSAKDSLTSETIYEYSDLDKRKNWTKKMTSVDGKPITITIRKIVYKEDIFMDSKSIAGIWTESDSNSWTEFKEDGQYHSGYREDIRDIGKWELNTKNKTLTFESNTPTRSKKYTYEFDGEFLILFTLSGKEEERYHRR